MLRVNLALVETASKRLWIAAGYFVPGEIMQTALQVAASRGVDVRILISQKSEHPLLVKAGRSLPTKLFFAKASEFLNTARESSTPNTSSSTIVGSQSGLPIWTKGR